MIYIIRNKATPGQIKEMLEMRGDPCREGLYLSQFQRLNERAHLSLSTINQLYVAYYLDRDP